MQTEYHFTNAEGFDADLFAACMESDGEEITMPVLLASYQQCFVRKDGESEWELTGCFGMEPLQAATQEMKKILETYPELSVRFPQRIQRDERQSAAVNQASVYTNGYAEITVPKEFSSAFSGADFRALLLEKWQEQLGRLAEKIVTNLRRFELRTARMFVPDGTLWKVNVYCGKEDVYTDVWSIAYEKADFYPLLWHTEVCGLSGILQKQLENRLKTEENELSSRLYRDEKQQHCVIELQLKEANT